MADWKTGERRTIESVHLSRTPDGWYAVIDGVEWFFVKKTNRELVTQLWQGYTGDHLTGTGLHYTLKAVLRWVKDNRREIAAKLAIRRKQKKVS